MVAAPASRSHAWFDRHNVPVTEDAPARGSGPDQRLCFPSHFLWGAATSAHQVEGGNHNSDWWRSEKQRLVPHRSGVACASWNRWPEEVELLRTLELNAYRISVEWARIEPEPGRFDQAALDRYRRMLESLRAAGIEPLVTLHHFTNPQWLADRGGWAMADVVPRFASYADRVGRALGDLVESWITINEPNACGVRGYLRGDWPPHRTADFRGFRRHLRHSAQAHVAARQALRARRADARLSVAFACWPLMPLRRRHVGDLVAARVCEWLWHGRFLAGLVTALDWIGVNYYTRLRVRWNLQAGPRPATPSGGGQTTDAGWEIYPEGLYQVLRSVGHHGKPVMVTENGLADALDVQRGAFIVAHLRQVRRAIQAGVDVRGYFYWSLLDNFEWTEGYAMRYGLAHVDFRTQVRSLRPSALRYRDIVRASRSMAAQEASR